MESSQFGSRNRSSTTNQSQNMSYSVSSSAYSSSTAASSRKSTTTNYSAYSTKSADNPFKNSARSLLDAILKCFTPSEPEVNSSNGFNDNSDVSTNARERRRRIYGTANPSTHAREPGSVKFTINEIHKATRNFSVSNKIGQGGFGTVYKGKLEDGTLIAVKRAKKTVYHQHLGVEFQSEIQTLAQVEHLNLVKLYGCLDDQDEKILVVEYVSNGTLREHLDGPQGDALDFSSRLDIAIDVAHAITYLHTYTDHPIIHRDVKSSNILLTENLRAKVADFGFARMSSDAESGNTHISTQVKGTAGYLDPEYLRTYQLTEKSDVYSFGVLLVELLTGRRPLEPKRDPKERLTVKWAMKKFADGDAILTLDPRLLRSPENTLAMEKIYELSLKCLSPHRKGRPSMKKCAEILWSIRKEYNETST